MSLYTDCSIIAAHAKNNNYGATKVGPNPNYLFRVVENYCSLSFFNPILDYVISGNKENPSGADYLDIRSFACTCKKSYEYVCDFFREKEKWLDFAQKGNQDLAQIGRLQGYGGELTVYGEKKLAETGSQGKILIPVLIAVYTVVAVVLGVVAHAIAIAIICGVIALLFALCYYVGRFLYNQYLLYCDSEKFEPQAQDVNVI